MAAKSNERWKGAHMHSNRHKQTHTHKKRVRGRITQGTHTRRVKIGGQMSREGHFSGVGAYHILSIVAPFRSPDLWEGKKRKEHTDDVNRKGEMAREGHTHTERHTVVSAPGGYPYWAPVLPTRCIRSRPPGWCQLLLAAARNTRGRACRPEEYYHQVSISVPQYRLRDTKLLVRFFRSPVSSS